ncbi:MAG: protein subunit release factor B [Candidatus Omnitrophota bacterium]|jgi:protein subunit release factor B
MTTARFPVSPKKIKELEDLFAMESILEKDLQESFIRSTGSGGQNVNKVSTCVVLVHKPTQIRVRCQRERSRGMNRYFARKLLAQKMQTLREGKKSAAQQKIAKIKRQKRKRSKRAKDKMLDSKHKRGEVKNLRKRVLPDN